jgi:hypothetical protein
MRRRAGRQRNPSGIVGFPPTTVRRPRVAHSFARYAGKNDIPAFTIYETPPEVHPQYPVAIDHMQSVQCEMHEPDDTYADVAAYLDSQFCQSFANSQNPRKRKILSN